MDTLTHALSGALLARATAGRASSSTTAGRASTSSTPGRASSPTTEGGGSSSSTADPASVSSPAERDASTASPDATHPPLSLRARVGAGFIAAAFPDADIVLTFVSPVAYLTQHRGVTHSWLLLPLWALLLAWVFARVVHGGANWRAYVGVCALSIAIHILGDWITSFGTMMLAPFSDQRFALGTTFIIDLIFTGIIVAGLIGSLLWRRSRIPAVLGLIVLSGYVGFQWLQQQKALAFGERYAQEMKLTDYRVAALPRPLSPFNWTVFVTQGEHYYVSHINVARQQTPPQPAATANLLTQLSAPYRALGDARWQAVEQFGENERERPLVREAWQQNALGFYRWFAAFPVLDEVEQSPALTCVWFRDARFDVPGRSVKMFRYGMCREPGAPWRAFKRETVGRTAL